jgi:hypothetical protein
MAHGGEIPINEIKDGPRDMSIWRSMPNIVNVFEKDQKKQVRHPRVAVSWLTVLDGVTKSRYILTRRVTGA